MKQKNKDYSNIILISIFIIRNNNKISIYDNCKY